MGSKGADARPIFRLLAQMRNASATQGADLLMVLKIVREGLRGKGRQERKNGESESVSSNISSASEK
ncbi:hypothetical protein B7463_g5041, partial [Scytalidium lignicola]